MLHTAVVCWRCYAAKYNWSGFGVQAVMVVADAEISLTITGNGDVLEPYDGVIGTEMLLLCPCEQLFAVLTVSLLSTASHQTK